MLRVVRAFSVLPVLLLGACASGLPGASTQEIDQQRVASIDRAAVGRGVKVYWESMPTKRVAPAPAAAATPG
jgi:hypothetical protein